MSRALSLALLALSTLAQACARDAAQVAWDRDFRREDDPAALLALATRAPRAQDAGTARLEAGRRLIALQRDAEALRVFAAMAQDAPRRADRARGHYEVARLAEDHHRLDVARPIYQRLVRTYPDLMPGERALAHLLRIARTEGPAAVDAHLAWTASLRTRLAATPLSDDLIFQAADEARLRAERDPTPARWRLAEKLYDRLARGRTTDALWNDAVWALSHIYHAQGRYREEVLALRRILATRLEVSLFGQNEHPYFHLGLRRIARVELVDLDDPRAAANTFLEYANLYPGSILRDDMRYFAICAKLRANARENDTRFDDEIADLIAALKTDTPDSKYLRRLPLAQSDPFGPHCVPPEVK
jgi:tetratricopeptide (TPR) repeat protein